MSAVAYTTVGAVYDLIGSAGVSLRTDDSAAPALVADAIAYATARIDYYCSQYSQADLVGSQWVQDAATFIAVRWLCLRRLNKIPRAIQTEWKERKDELEAIREGKATVPRLPTSRRPATVTNYHVDLRRANDQVRVDTTRSTGRAKGYTRPTDPTAPDQR